MASGLKMEHINLVLLPGMDGTGLLFEPFLHVLPGHYRPFVVSFPADEPQNYQQLLPRIRDIAPWDEPYVLLAESFSGPLALYFAQAQPENVEAIILSASFARNPLSPFLAWVHSLLGARLFKKAPPARILQKYLTGPDAPPSLLELLTTTLRSVEPEVLAHRVELILKTDARQALRDCQAPLLFLLAAQDQLLGRRGLESVLEAKPDLTCVEIDAPHMLLQTKPREALTAIEMFLQQPVPTS